MNGSNIGVMESDRLWSFGKGVSEMDRWFANPAYGWVRSLAAAISGGLGFYGAVKDRRVAGLPYDAWLLLCIAYTVSIVLHFQARILRKLEQED